MSNTFFTVDLSEKFPSLAKPPIVQAVIHWRARATNRLGPEAIKTALADELPGYPQRKHLRHVGMMAEVSSESGARITPMNDWAGLRLKSDDKKYTIQFRRDELFFSRTNGYDHWETFIHAAKDAWRTYLKIAQPEEIQRLSVRFINQIPVATPENIGVYLREPPTCPENLQLKEFVYQSTFVVPELPFTTRVTKVIQPLNPELQRSSGLFLDIEVNSKSVIATDETALDQTLDQIRWMKNKVFFTLVTGQAIQLFGGGI